MSGGLRNWVKLGHPHSRHMLRRGSRTGHRGTGAEPFLLSTDRTSTEASISRRKVTRTFLQMCQAKNKLLTEGRTSGPIRRSATRGCWPPSSVVYRGKHARALSLVLLSPCLCPRRLPKEKCPELGTTLFASNLFLFPSRGNPRPLPPSRRILPDGLDHSIFLSPNSYHERTTRPRRRSCWPRRHARVDLRAVSFSTSFEMALESRHVRIFTPSRIFIFDLQRGDDFCFRQAASCHSHSVDTRGEARRS